MMNFQRCDALESEMVESLLRDEISLRKAIGIVARSNPDDSARDLMFACLSLCANFNGNFGPNDKVNTITLSERYQAVAGLSADIIGIAAHSANCGDLVAHWIETEDTIFR